MKANEAPEKVYIEPNLDSIWGMAERSCESEVEYVKTDAFIERACEWIKENITNNPNANSVLVRNGCVTFGMLVEDFKKYMND